MVTKLANYGYHISLQCKASIYIPHRNSRLNDKCLATRFNLNKIYIVVGTFRQRRLACALQRHGRLQEGDDAIKFPAFSTRSLTSHHASSD